MRIATDADGNGFLTTDEIKVALKDLGVSLNAEDLVRADCPKRPGTSRCVHTKHSQKACHFQSLD